MPESKQGKILAALRERLTDGQYDVYLGKVIDPQQDVLPAVTIFHGKDGDTVVKHRPRLTQEMSIVVECWIVAGDDPTLDCYEFAQPLREAIAPKDSTDSPDYLDGLAHKVEYQQTLCVTRDRQHATVQLRLSIQY